jgi:TetR/AcrR family transcriptional regulator, transcriptional repressor for nem operon
MSRVSREQAARNRAKVVAAASELYRRHGFDGVGIRELMAQVGLTQGGFAGQFGSKDALAGEACANAFESAERAWRNLGSGDAGERLRTLVGFYLTPKPPGYDCPMAALAGDAARAPAGGPVRRAFTAGLHRLTDVIAGERHDDSALTVLAAMVGAAVLRRASEDAALSDAIDSAVLRLAAAPKSEFTRMQDEDVEADVQPSRRSTSRRTVRAAP